MHYNTVYWYRKHVHVRPKVKHKRKYQINRSKRSMANAISKVTLQILEEKKKLDDLLDPESTTDVSFVHPNYS